MYKIEPQTLIDHKDEIIKELSRTRSDSTLIEIVTLSGTSICGEPAKLLKTAFVGATLYPTTPQNNLFPIVNDRGNMAGYLAAAPMLSFGITQNYGVYLTVEYSADNDGIPEIICSVWCRNG